jgi:hypothetical protein
MNNRVYYNPDQDCSEESGWSKLCDETVPSGAEQNLWAIRVIAAGVIFSVIGLLLS